MKKSLLMLGVWMLAFGGPALAQMPNGHPGYYPIEALGLLAVDELDVNVDLQGAILQVAAGAMQAEGEDADLARLVSKLERVRVQVGSPASDDPAAVEAGFGRAVKEMEGSGWNNILRVVQDGEQIHLFAREGGGSIVGLTALVSDGGDEIVLVNVVGSIDPVLLGRVIGKLGDLPNLGVYVGAGK